MYTTFFPNGLFGSAINKAAELVSASLFLLLVASSAVHAGGKVDIAASFNVNKRVSPSSRVTYLQLLAPVFPGAKPDIYGGLDADGTSDLRQLDTGSVKKGFGSALGLSAADGLDYAGGSRRMVLFWLRPDKDLPDTAKDSFAPDGRRLLPYQTMVLALFQTRGIPKLLDIVEVTPSDVQTYIASTNIGGYFWLVNYHANCEWYMKDYALISDRSDQLSIVFADLPMLYDNDDCGNLIKQEPYLVRATTRKGARSTIYLNVVSTVSERSPECSSRTKRPESKYFQFKLRQMDDGKFSVLETPKKKLRLENIRLNMESEDQGDKN